jgi:hypothetical protein
LHDDIYDQLSLIEEELYTDDELQGFDFDEEDY